MMSRRIVLVGASGVFGARLAAMIARWPDVVLVLAARRR
jgi:N-acetyl-gamma-glutamylphosphate reductase